MSHVLHQRISKIWTGVTAQRHLSETETLRTGIERTFGLVKENRYRMEETNFYKGIDNVTIHTVEHNIVLTQDIMFDYLTTGKKSPVLKLNY